MGRPIPFATAVRPIDESRILLWSLVREVGYVARQQIEADIVRRVVAEASLSRLVKVEHVDFVVP